MAQGFGSVPREPRPTRKNPPPTILEEQGQGVVLIAYGEPQDACPVDGYAGVLRFAHR
jgi:hypothetical protein